MTKREFRRLRAGNLVEERFRLSLWVVVERRRGPDPCLILERAAGMGLERAPGPEVAYFVEEGKGNWANVWAVHEGWRANFRRLA